MIIEISLSIKSWIPYIQGCFVCVEFGWNSPVVVEIKIYKFCQCVFAMSLSSPLGVTLHLNTWKVTWISLCHIWLKFVQWIDLKKICCQCTSIFAIISHKKRAFPFIFYKIGSPLPKNALRQVWLNWLFDFEKTDLKFRQCIFARSLHPRIICANLFEIGPVLLEWKMKMERTTDNRKAHLNFQFRWALK